MEQRIIDAAWRLWNSEDQRVSIRSIAHAAGTSTPSIYRRFHNSRALVRELLARQSREFEKQIGLAGTLQDALEVYVDFAVRHKEHYSQFFHYQQELLHRWLKTHPTCRSSGSDGHGFPAWVFKKLSRRSSANDSNQVAKSLVLLALAHGVASLLTTSAITPEAQEDVRAEYRKTIARLLND